MSGKDVYGLMGSWAQEFRSSNVERFRGSEVQRLRG
jgi:hypothetical protein